METLASVGKGFSVMAETPMAATAMKVLSASLVCIGLFALWFRMKTNRIIENLQKQAKKIEEKEEEEKKIDDLENANGANLEYPGEESGELRHRRK